MSYRCKTCRGIVPSGKPRLVHLVKRADGSIARELAVCATCQDFLARGTSASNLTATPTTESVVDAVPVSTKHQTNNKSKIVSTGD